MTPTPNSMMGSVLYRTIMALNGNSKFLYTLHKEYQYAPSCIINDRLNVRYYPGTHGEISSILNFLAQDPEQSMYKFPALFSFQSIIQPHNGSEVFFIYNLALCGSVDPRWETTSQQEVQTFDLLLRPLYEEFMRQIMLYPYFDSSYGNPPHNLVDRFTTDGNKDGLIDRYGDYIAAIELHELQIKVRTNLCKNDLETIARENALLTTITD